MKRICVLSGGTYDNLDRDVTTNIALLTQSISPVDPKGVEQVLCYDAGLGAEGSIVDKVLGAAGIGIDLNIKQLYTFLALNYNPGDEVYMFGYSRGAYTVRSLAGFIQESGLVKRSEVTFVDDAYELYKRDLGLEHEELKAFRAAHGEPIPIHLVACFDTVRALGLRDNPLGKFFSSYNELFEFHRDTMFSGIKNAIHALSIDEMHPGFNCTVMEPEEESGPQQVTEFFFWGNHRGMGGGDSHMLDSSNIVLNFMVREIARRGLGLAFDASKLPEEGNALGQAPPEEKPLLSLSPPKEREISSISKVHKSAIWRYQNVPEWRPQALEHLKETLLSVKIDVIDDNIASV